MTNLGPNAMTYLLAGEVFPTHIRGKGAGFAASFAKVGAVLTAFLFPILLHTIGTIALLYMLVFTSVLGAAITWMFAIETKGLNLESLGARESSSASPKISEKPDPKRTSSARVAFSTSTAAIKRRPRILLADDHMMLVDAFRRLLEPQCEIVGTTCDGRALLELAANN